MDTQEQIDDLRKNILWNWPHLSHYGKQMNDAADAMTKMLEALKEIAAGPTTGDGTSNYEDGWNDAGEIASKALEKSLADLRGE